jgi:hypothetical protein
MADQGAVARAEERGNVDAVGQGAGRWGAGVLRRSRCVPERNPQDSPRHRRVRYKRIEQMSDRDEALRDGRRGSLLAELLDVGRDAQGSGVNTGGIFHKG